MREFMQNKNRFFISKSLKCLFITSLLSLLSINCIFAAEVKTVKVGWISHKGLQNNDNGVFSGYTYDYLMEIANYTGWQYEFIPGELGDTLKNLQDGQIDIVGGLIPNEERKQTYDLPNNEYGRGYISLFTTQESKLEPYDFKSYDGMCVGAVRNATANLDAFRTYAKENDFSYTLLFYGDGPAVEKAVANKEVDAGMFGLHQSTSDTKTLAEFSPIPFTFAVTKGNKEILSGLNKAINQIRIDNPYLEIELYKENFSSLKSVKLTDEELAIVNASKEKPITIGVVDNSAPLFFMDPKTNEYSGLVIDMLKLSAQKTGLNYSFIPIDINRASQAKTPNANSPRVVVGITHMKTIADTRDWYLSDTLLSDTLVLVGKRGYDITSEPSKKTLAVMSGFAMAKNYAKKYFPEYNIIELENLEECLVAIEKGEADGTLYLRSCINYLLQKPFFENLEIIPSFSDDIDTLVAAFTEENKEIIRIINKGINMITEEESRNITFNYTIMNPYKLTMVDIFYKYRAPLFIIVLLIIVIVVVFMVLFMIKRRVAEKLKEAFEQEKKALEIAEQASAAKGNFMSRMSHEIRTPLNAIIGYNTIASSDITEAKSDSDYKQTIMKVADCLSKSSIATKHLLTIINDVLDMSAIESGKIKLAHDKFDFKGLINSLTTIFYSQAKTKDVEFEVIFDSLIDEWVIGDQMRTSQILTNLLSNAVKFTSEGGKVLLAIHQSSIEEKSERIHFEVSDSGIGMSEEYLEHIWTPFEQADSSISRRFGGTGLGLAITKNLVDLLGGQITVSSKQGEGTIFKVDLTFDRTEQPATKNTYDFSKINALVVDDDASTCDYIKLLMNRFGAHCTTVTSGQDAIKAVSTAEEKKEPFSICIVDWRMPKMDGLETIKHIRTVAGQDVPIIVITAYDFTEVVDKASEVGITKFISKPLFQSTLFDLLVGICSNQNIPVVEKSTKVHFDNSRILLAEDNTMNMEIAKRILESTGLVIESAWNGQEAVEIFENSEVGKYQAILMDVQMPIMDGYEATKKIRSSNHPEAKTIPIIAMTADAFAENVAEALNVGMNDHVSKPIDLTTLFETLKKYIKSN